MRNQKVCNLALIYGRIAKIPACYRKLGSGNATVMSDFWEEVEICPFRACAMKKCNLTLIYGRIAKMFESYSKSGSGNTMVTSDFWPEVEIWPFRACAIKICNLAVWCSSRWSSAHPPMQELSSVTASVASETASSYSSCFSVWPECSYNILSKYMVSWYNNHEQTNHHTWWRMRASIPLPHRWMYPKFGELLNFKGL